MPRRSKFDPVRWALDNAREEFPGLDEENEFLRGELRRLLNLADPPKPPRPVILPPRSGKAFRKHFVVPDSQIAPGVPTRHMKWAGQYIAEKASPGDVVVHLGDHWDMESLCSYDKGKRQFEGRRYKADVECGNVAFALLSEQLDGLPIEKHLLRGNHEHRITRALETEPWLDGVIGLHDLHSPGWTVHEFLEPFVVDGCTYVHYAYNPRNGKPWGGLVSTVLKNVGSTFIQGHRQGLEVATHQLPNGQRRRGVVVGSFYEHDPSYLGPQAGHWRGILMLTEVRDGDFDLVEVSIDYLRRKYG